MKRRAKETSISVRTEKLTICKKKRYFGESGKLTINVFENTVERLRLRLQIYFIVMSVSIPLNFGLLVYFLENLVQQKK